MLNNPGSFWRKGLYQSVLPTHISWKRTVSELHSQPDHRTDGLVVMMSLFCLGPQGCDLWANLGRSLQIPGLSLPGELLMVQWDGATVQQKSSQLTGPDIHLYDSTHQEKEELCWIHFAAYVDVHMHIQACTHTHRDQYTLTCTEVNTE